MKATRTIARLPDGNTGETIICKLLDEEDIYIMKTSWKDRGTSTKWERIGKVELEHTILKLHFGMSNEETQEILSK